jgi:FkbM family methyltransferase
MAWLERRGLVHDHPPKDLSHWRAAQGDERLRLDYPLTADSIVVDVGGYEGQWASDIHARYGCTVHIFEPIIQFQTYLDWRFQHNSKVIVHPLGLSDRDSEATFRLSADRTGLYKDSGPECQVRLVAAAPFLSEIGVQSIDLMKINIEGAEYDLIEHLVDTNYIHRIQHLQVQFHDFFPDAQDRLARAREVLAITHEPQYQFKFIWESWKLRT